MKLWILERRKDLPAIDNPWRRLVDVNLSVIVRAYTEGQARNLAQDSAGAESGPGCNRHEVWLDNTYTTCKELTTDGEAEVVLVNNSSS